MPKMTVTASEGVRAKVTIQEDRRLAVLDNNGNPQAIDNWQPIAVDTFASEAREYDVDAGKRLVVELQ